MRHGPFVWHELMVPNPGSAPSFYKSVTGWNTEQFQGGMDYTMWLNGQAPVGGLMPLPKELADVGVPAHWLHYVGVNDVDETSAKAEQLGGKVNVPPTDIPNVGRFAVIADPQGAVFAIYTSSQENGPGGEPQIGEFSWHELGTSNREEAFQFYSQLFGWKETSSMDMGDGETYQMFGLDDGVPIGGVYKLTKQLADAPPNWMGYVRVADVDPAIDAVKQGGGQVLNGPMDIPGGRIAVFMDPQGAAFAAHQQNA